MRNIALLLVAVVAVVSFGNQAEAKKGKAVMSKSEGQQGTYGMAGCGLGAILFKDKNDKVSQILAATTNGTSGNQTFGITTGTLECTDDGTMHFSRAKEIFMESNQDKLLTEMAQGNGDYLTVLGAFYGCKGQNVSDFGRFTQDNFADFLAAPDHRSFMNAVDSKFASSKLAQTCGA